MSLLGGNFLMLESRIMSSDNSLTFDFYPSPPATGRRGTWCTHVP